MWMSDQRIQKRPIGRLVRIFEDMIKISDRLMVMQD
jgi:hypothetical protein